MLLVSENQWHINTESPYQKISSDITIENKYMGQFTPVQSEDIKLLLAFQDQRYFMPLDIYSAYIYWFLPPFFFYANF